MERFMRSPEAFYKTFLGDPADPNYACRVNAYNLERMARAYRAMVIGEMLANGILWVARPILRIDHS
jgi:hypothetical protein